MSRTIPSLVFIMCTALAACERGGTTLPSAPSPASQVASPQATAQRAGNTIQITTSGMLIGATQMLAGRNDSSSIVAKGDYTWSMNLDLAALSCPPQPGAIPWQPGLVVFVQNHTPRSGKLDLHYDKVAAPDPSRVDSWETSIDGLNYKVQIFRWSSASSTNNPAGSTTVFYRGGSIEVFKKQRGRVVSREQCFGNYVDYDLTAS